MSGKRSKKHHFLPQTIQKRFLNSDGQIWFSERRPSGSFNPVELRGTGSTFKIRNYYTVLREGVPSDVVERRHFGAIDDFIGRFLEGSLPILTSGRPPTVSPDNMSDLRSVVVAMMERNPDHFTRIFPELSDEAIGKKFVQGLIEEIASADDITSEEKRELEQKLSDKVYLKTQGRDIRVKSLLVPSKRTLEELEKFELRWACCCGKASFILPSCSIFRLGNGGSTGLQNPDAEIWMPISPKYSLVLLQDHANRVPILNQLQRDKVREINLHAVRMSSQIASHSDKLLKSVISPR